MVNIKIVFLNLHLSGGKKNEISSMEPDREPMVWELKRKKLAQNVPIFKMFDNLSNGRIILFNF